MSNDRSRCITKTRDQLYEMYINALREDELPWEKPWKGGLEMHPVNPVSGTKYRGINRMLLWMESDRRNIEDGRWATFNQIADRKNIYHPGTKWHLKAGSKHVPVELWKIRKVGTKELIDFSDYKQIIDKDPDQMKNYQLYSQTYYVYSYADIEGVPEMEQTKQNTVAMPDLQEFCDEVLNNIGVSITHEGSEAYYSPKEDKIVIPSFDRFRTAEDYYATRLHETAHSTGAPNRLNRDLKGIFGSESYAKEELRAEIASSILFADLKLPASAETLDNHKAYIQNWIADLEKDPLILFQAIKDAEKISDYILENGPIAREKIYEHLAEPAEELSFAADQVMMI